MFKNLKWLMIGALAVGFTVLISPATPKFYSSNGIRTSAVEVTSPLVIAFDRPVSKNELKLNIYPTIEGSWSTNGNSVISEAVFYPKVKMKPGTTYKIVVLGTRNAFSKLPTREREFSFVTERAPVLISGTGVKKETKNFPVSGHISLVFDRPNRVRELRFEITPNVKNHMKSNASGVDIFFEENLTQETFYKYVLYDETIPADDKTFVTGSFTTVPPPHIKSASPIGDHVFIDEKIRIVFDTPIDRVSLESHFSISPNVDGAIIWPSDLEFNFTPKSSLQYATDYIFTVSKGVRTKTGGVLEADLVVKFKTIGPVVVTAISPAQGATSVPVSISVIVVFDQAIDHASAESAWSISPAVTGSFVWDGNGFTFNHPTALAYGTAYTFLIKSGVKSILGQDMQADFIGSFTTISAITRLAVPVYYQQYALSCEESSLRAALAYRGIYVSDWDVLMKVGYNPRNRDFGTNSWDDPNAIFVGYISGQQNTTGYGVHWGPIAKAAHSYGRGATAFSNWSAADLANQIQSGNPVIIWGIYGVGKNDGWNSPNGYKYAPKGEHTRLVVGFYGPASNPTSFILNDPLAGQITWSTGTLFANWSWFSNSGVVVY